MKLRLGLTLISIVFLLASLYVLYLESQILELEEISIQYQDVMGFRMYSLLFNIYQMLWIVLTVGYFITLILSWCVGSRKKEEI